MTKDRMGEERRIVHIGRWKKAKRIESNVQSGQNTFSSCSIRLAWGVSLFDCLNKRMI